MIDACPSRARWREWLDDPLSAAEHTELAVHLEGCLHCQRLLDDLVGADGGWADLAHGITAAVPEPEFARALHELKDRPPEDAPPLSFLQPSDNAEHLGKLDGYEVLSEVGRGGMGVVLKAFDPKLRRVVAIKVLAPHLAANATARKRFLREARAAAAVVHENVVTIHAVEESAGTPYLVMQFVPGRSLQDRLDNAGPLTVKEILRIGMQTAAGLAAAHAQGLVHRDIKPANILLENGVERVKLADFGLARAADDASLTASGVLAGSPQFMAPEQARGDTVDQRSDLFALGAVLYTMAAGRPPFRAPTALAVLKRICDDAPRSLREVNPDVPDWFEAIVFKLLAKDPAERFASAAAVADVLGQHLRCLQHPEAQVPAPVVVPASARPRRAEVTRHAADRTSAPKKSNRVVWVVLACVLGLFLLCSGIPVLGVLAMAFWTVGRSASPEAALVTSEGQMTEHSSQARMTPEASSQDRVQLQRGLIETLTDPDAPELAKLRLFCTIEKVAYNPTTRTVSWTATTRSRYRLLEEAQVNLKNACVPFRFFDQGGKQIGERSPEAKLGKKAADNSYQVFFDLRLTEEILKETASFEIIDR
jgi:serine/threonine protein kinase